MGKIEGPNALRARLILFFQAAVTGPTPEHNLTYINHLGNPGFCMCTFLESRDPDPPSYGAWGAL